MTVQLTDKTYAKVAGALHAAFNEYQERCWTDPASGKADSAPAKIREALDLIDSIQRLCPTCKGSSYVGEDDCPACGGTGIAK